MGKKLLVKVEGKSYEVEIQEIESNATVDKVSSKTETSMPKKKIVKNKESTTDRTDGETVSAPIPGKILSINVKEGDKVSKGDVLLILEAMKMENEITAAKDGEIKKIVVSEGQSVQSGETLIVIG